MNRNREWIHKPVFHGAPVSWAREYFRGRLKKFRNDHKEFDAFLIDLYSYLKDEKEPDYKNLCLFIEGESETNWISPDGGLFDIFIKLFNLCLSPEQAFEYIKKCHQWYLFLLGAKYKISNKPEFSIRKNALDGKNVSFVDIDVFPKDEPDDWDYYYWFHISTSLTIVEDYYNYITCHVNEIRLVCNRKELEDVLMLFVNHQNKPLLRSVFNTAIKELADNGLIKKIKTEKFYNWTIHYYDTDFTVKKETNIYDE